MPPALPVLINYVRSLMAPSRKRGKISRVRRTHKNKTAALLLLSPRALTAPSSPQGRAWGRAGAPSPHLPLLSFQPLPSASRPRTWELPALLHPQPPAAKAEAFPALISPYSRRVRALPGRARGDRPAPSPQGPPPPPGARRGPGSGSGSAGFCLGPASPPSLPPSRPL